MQTPASILVINVSRIGDTLLAIPAIRALAEHWPDANLTVLAHPSRQELLRNLPYIDHVGSIDKNRARWLGYMAGNKYDLAVVFGFDRPLVTYALRQARAVCAFRQADDRINRRLAVVAEPYLPNSGHIAKLQMRLVEALGVHSGNLALDYRVSEAENAWAKQRLAQDVGAARAPLIGLQVASFPTKSYRDWPLQNFIDICHRIQARWANPHFLILGGAAEAQRTEALHQELKGCSTLYAGKLTLRQTGALMQQLDLFIGVDTGPTHIMGTLGRPMIVLYHPAHPSWKLAPPARADFFAVDHPVSDGIEQADLSMDGISVESVWDRVVRALAQHPPVSSAQRQFEHNVNP